MSELEEEAEMTKGDWKEWLDHLRNVPGYADGIHGFLVALDQCIATYKESLGIPDVELWRKGLEAAA